MKYLLLAVCAGLLAGAPAMGQALPVDSATQRVTYRGVVQVPGVSQAELYTRAREWFAVTFGSAKAVLEMEDRATGKLIGNEAGGYTQNGQPVLVWRRVNIEVKDGRFRYEFTNFGTGNTFGSARPVELAMVPAAYDKQGRLKPYMAVMFAGIQQSAEEQVLSLRAALTRPAAKSSW